MKNLLKLGAIAMGLTLVFSSCGKKESSDVTGWNFNDTKGGGFEKNLDYEDNLRDQIWY